MLSESSPDTSKGAAGPQEQDRGRPGEGGHHCIHTQPRGRLRQGGPGPAGPAVESALGRDGEETAGPGRHVPGPAVLL